MQAVPRGHPDCLTGKTFVITGNLESLGRDEAAEVVKRHSGRVTGSVSGKTTFLLVGQDSGKKKIDTVRQPHPALPCLTIPVSKCKGGPVHEAQTCDTHKGRGPFKLAVRLFCGTYERCVMMTTAWERRIVLCFTACNVKRDIPTLCL